MMAINRWLCRWESFVGTWFDLGMWATRLRVLTGAAGPPISWPGVRYVAHRLDTDAAIFRADSDGREHEWMRCVRCGALIYQGWRRLPWFAGDESREACEQGRQSVEPVRWSRDDR